MQNTFSPAGAVSKRRLGPIVVAVVAAAVLSAAAAMLAPPHHASVASPGPRGGTAAIVPTGIVGDSAVAGDPSVPRASAVFKGDAAAPEESRGDTF